MKRILSIFMLFAMLFVGVGPTVGMHFCGDSLHSIELIDHAKVCCSATTQNNSTDIDCLIDHKICCETKEVQFGTDNFQQQERTLNLANILPSFDNIWLDLNYSTSLLELETTTKTKDDFPPGGYDVKDLDILGFICILRI